jgi:hypothetical protein
MAVSSSALPRVGLLDLGCQVKKTPPLPLIPTSSLHLPQSRPRSPRPNPYSSHHNFQSPARMLFDSSALRPSRFWTRGDSMLTDVGTIIPRSPLSHAYSPRNQYRYPPSGVNLHEPPRCSFLPHFPPSCPRRYRFPKQSGRHRPASIPYGKPPADRDAGGRPRGTLPPNGPPGSNLAARIGRGTINPNSAPGRLPRGTPAGLQKDRAEVKKAQGAAHASLNEKLGGEDMKQWLRSRLIGEGVLNMSVGRSETAEDIAK